MPNGTQYGDDGSEPHNIEPCVRKDKSDLLGLAVGSGEHVPGEPGRDPFAQRLEEELHFDRLGEVVVHARRQTLLAAAR